MKAESITRSQLILQLGSAKAFGKHLDLDLPYPGKVDNLPNFFGGIGARLLRLGASSLTLVCVISFGLHATMYILFRSFLST